MSAPHPMPDTVLEEMRRIVSTVRGLIENARLVPDPKTNLDGIATLVLMTSYVVLAKSHGLSREQFMTAMGNVWDLNDQVTKEPSP